MICEPSLDDVAGAIAGIASSVTSVVAAAVVHLRDAIAEIAVGIFVLDEDADVVF